MTWIPVSERLPDLDVPAWAAFTTEYKGKVSDLHHGMLVRTDGWDCPEADATGWGWSVVHAVPYYHNGAWCYDAEMDDDYTVIAWQPLPEPFTTPSDATT